MCDCSDPQHGTALLSLPWSYALDSGGGNKDGDRGVWMGWAGDVEEVFHVPGQSSDTLGRPCLFLILVPLLEKSGVCSHTPFTANQTRGQQKLSSGRTGQMKTSGVPRWPASTVKSHCASQRSLHHSNLSVSLNENGSTDSTSSQLPLRVPRHQGSPENLTKKIKVTL